MSENVSPQELEDRIVEKIKTVYDPEIPVNIYDLGLIYDISITAQNEAVILMTLTSPACPEAGQLPGEVELQAKEVEGISDAKVILTFNPPWDKSMMSDAAALELGLF
ncbi:MAG: iron-sulfur cluster assembly protein [Candidatus Kapaibacterium sp.]|jgi:FeS assembly SUF system protein|nr:iron-sulfur cluster assembly protein [Candidatus Kapabacteria bacterium]